MNPEKVFSYIIPALCLASAAACGGDVQANEDPQEQLAPSLAAESAPPLEPEQIEGYLPVGVLVGSSGDNSLNVYNTEGQMMAEIAAPGISSVDPEHIHLAGKTNGEAFAVPLVYHSWDPEQALMVSTQDDVHAIYAAEQFLALAGAPGQNALAFSKVTIDNNSPHSYLYTGSLEDLEMAAPFYDLIDEPTQMALSPVGVTAVNGTSQGVWYTKTGWGIGGADLIFPITRGLYYYDLISGENLQYIDPERSFQGISPDYSMAGSVAFDFEGDRSMTIVDLDNNQTRNFPLKSSSDRGAGFVVFSPDNLYAAWLEGSGSFIDDPETFQGTVRVGDLTNGNVVVEIEDSIISRNLDNGTVSFIKPVGWLGDQSLLIEVRGEDWGDVSMMRLDLGDLTISFFCEGGFAGFVYP